MHRSSLPTEETIREMVKFFKNAVTYRSGSYVAVEGSITPEFHKHLTDIGVIRKEEPVNG